MIAVTKGQVQNVDSPTQTHRKKQTHMCLIFYTPANLVAIIYRIV